MARFVLKGILRGTRRSRGGFTLVEVMTAMAISATALTANLYLFNFAQKNLAESRSITDATNLASAKIADFKTQLLGAIASGNDAPVANGVTFNRVWTVSNVDVDHDGTDEMVGDVVKIRLKVTWIVNKRKHELTMTTMSTGRQS